MNEWHDLILYMKPSLPRLIFKVHDLVIGYDRTIVPVNVLLNLNFAQLKLSERRRIFSAIVIHSVKSVVNDFYVSKFSLHCVSSKGKYSSVGNFSVK